MLFSYFITTIASLVGPVTGYSNFNMTDHVTAEYVETGNQCTLGVTFTQRNDESSIAWDKTTVVDEVGNHVKVVDDVSYAALPPDGILVGGISSFGNRSANSMIWESKTSYVFISTAPKFKFNTRVSIYVDDKLSHVEDKMIYCNVDACECSTRAYPER